MGSGTGIEEHSQAGSSGNPTQEMGWELGELPKTHRARSGSHPWLLWIPRDPRDSTPRGKHLEKPRQDREQGREGNAPGGRARSHQPLEFQSIPAQTSPARASPPMEKLLAQHSRPGKGREGPGKPQGEGLSAHPAPDPAPDVQTHSTGAIFGVLMATLEQGENSCQEQPGQAEPAGSPPLRDEQGAH